MAWPEVANDPAQTCKTRGKTMHRKIRTTWVSACLTASLALSAATAVHAQTAFPQKPVSIIVPTTPGGTADIVARLISPKLSQQWGQPVVVENKPGAGTFIGSDYVARAPADGHTLLLTFSELASLPSINKNIKLDVVKGFTRIGRIGVLPVALLSHPSLPAKNAEELLALLRASPGKYTYSSNGPGSSLQLYTEIFRREADVDIMHVPYRGALEASLAAIAGEVDLLVQFASGNVINHVRADKLRAYAVASPERLQKLPEVPTAAEVGLPGFRLDAWYGLLGPAGLPNEIVNQINLDLQQALSHADVRERLDGINILVQTGSPAEFDRFFVQDHDRWARVIRESGIQSSQ